LRVRAVRIVADGDVQLAVGSEVDCAAVVIRGAAQIVELEQNRFAAGNRDIAVCGETAQAIVNRRRRRRVVHVYEVVRREVRVERDAE
jgi:hypothetical protein